MSALTDLIAEPGQAALFLDIDGVLAPIVDRPEDARVPEEPGGSQAGRAGRARLACVTGRPSDVARELVGVPELVYAGEHGMELDPEAAVWVWLAIAIAVVVANELMDRNFFDHREHIDGDVVVTLLKSPFSRFFGSFIVAALIRRRHRVSA